MKTLPHHPYARTIRPAFLTPPSLLKPRAQRQSPLSPLSRTHCPPRNQNQNQNQGTTRMTSTQRTPKPQIHIAKMPACPSPQLTYITAQKAVMIDETLMSPRYSHTLPQLMELAGLSVAHAVCDYTQLPTKSHIAIACGPGNNGGDGLVAARHLVHFGHKVTVTYPKPVPREPFQSLLAQLQNLDVDITPDLPEDATLIVDAVFGFSFAGDEGVREPFKTLIECMNAHAAPLLSVDVPSGWHVDRGNVYECAVKEPDALVSLTTPKLFARDLEGKEGFVHYVGGRFVPQRLCSEFGFEVPYYCGTDLIARVS